MRRKARRGFTLIEVLLVVGILALLAAFIVPSLIRSGDEAKVGLAKAAVGRTGPIAKALTKFRFDNGVYPEELADLAAKEAPDYLNMDKPEEYKGPYIEDVNSLKDPWGRDYQYRKESEIDPTTYQLWSNGPDKEEGTDDDIKGWTEEK
jgi:general secretion pathway protein G